MSNAIAEPRPMHGKFFTIKTHFSCESLCPWESVPLSVLIVYSLTSASKEKHIEASHQGPNWAHLHVCFVNFVFAVSLPYARSHCLLKEKAGEQKAPFSSWDCAEAFSLKHELLVTALLVAYFLSVACWMLTLMPDCRPADGRGGTSYCSTV